MIHNLVGVFYLCRLEHRLPHDGLKAYLVLAGHLHHFASVPKLGEVPIPVRRPAERRDVVSERIKPHIHNLLFVPRHRDTPAHACLLARDAKVLEPPLNKVEGLLSAPFGYNYPFLREVVFKILLVVTELKEVIFFLYLNRAHVWMVRAFTIN